MTAGYSCVKTKIARRLSASFCCRVPGTGFPRLRCIAFSEHPTPATVA